MLAVWAEMGLVVADQFRDGNVLGQMEPLEAARWVFAALPATVREYYYRGDSACHEGGLTHWLCDEKHEGGPQGKIGFAISADERGSARGDSGCPKRLRFLIFNVLGKLVHHACRLILRLAATVEWIVTYREALQLLPLKT